MQPQLGNYRLLHGIGNGAFAEVFLGKHIYIDRLAAIKVLYPQSLAGSANDFIDEARTAASLNHLHIIPVWEFGVEKNGTPYLVMEYANSGTLQKKYPPGKLRSPTEILPYLQQITEALAYVHSKQLTHRDIKPANMLLDSQKGVLLSDFGISSLAQQALGGTPAYMAPEQIQRKPEAASDQYALAVVIYEWLCGRCPFLPQSPGVTARQQTNEVWEQHLKQPPPALRQFAPTLSPDVERVVLKALDKDPVGRFANVEEFYQAFAQIVAPRSYSVHSTPSSFGQAATVYPSANLPPTLPGNYPAQPVPSNPRQAATVYSPRVLPSTVPIGRVKQQGEMLYSLCDELTIRADLPCGAIHTLAWSPDGQWLAAGAKLHMIFTWPALTGDQIQRHRLHKDQIFSVAWSPDSQLLASGSSDQVLYVWQPGKDQPLLIYSGHGGPRFSLSPACVVSWSPDGLRLASAGADATVQVWRANGDRLLTCHEHTQGINALAWSPDGSRVASASDDQIVHLWDATSGILLNTWHHHRGYVRTLGWSPDGTHLASGGADAAIYVWEPVPLTQTYKQLIYQGHTRAVHALAWSPNSTLLASGGGDRSVQIWDAASGQHRYTYSQHTSSILALAWSSDGRYIASADEDGAVHVWWAA